MTLLDVPFSDLNFNTQDHKFSVHEIQDGDKEQSIIKPFFPKIRPSFDFNSLFAGRSGSESTWNCLHCFCFCWASQRENPHNNECYQSDCLSIDVEFSHQIKANEPRKNILKIGIQSKWRTSSEYSLCMVFVLFFFFISERKKISLDRHSFETLKTTTYRNWTYFIPTHTIERPEKNRSDERQILSPHIWQRIIQNVAAFLLVTIHIVSHHLFWKTPISCRVCWDGASRRKLIFHTNASDIGVFVNLSWNFRCP